MTANEELGGLGGGGCVGLVAVDEDKRMATLEQQDNLSGDLVRVGQACAG